jgi:hypothetical protein
VRRWLIGAVALVVLALGLFQFRSGLLELFPGLGADRELQTAAQKAAKAAGDFAALSKDAYRTGNVPRQSDPSAGPLLDAVFNIDLLKSKTTLEKADLGSLADWSAAQGKVGSIYIFSGTGISDPSRATNDPALRQQVDHNTAQYAPELGRYMDAELLLQGAMLAVIEANGTSGDHDNASVKSGIENVRGGVTTTMSGVISTFAVDGINDDWRRGRLIALNALAPKAAKLLLPEQCKLLVDAAQTVSQSMTDAAVQGGFRTFTDALKC